MPHQDFTASTSLRVCARVCTICLCIASPGASIHLASFVLITRLMRAQEIKRVCGRVFLAEIFSDLHKISDESVDELNGRS